MSKICHVIQLTHLFFSTQPECCKQSAVNGCVLFQIHCLMIPPKIKKQKLHGIFELHVCFQVHHWNLHDTPLLSHQRPRTWRRSQTSGSQSRQKWFGMHLSLVFWFWPYLWSSFLQGALNEVFWWKEQGSFWKTEFHVYNICCTRLDAWTKSQEYIYIISISLQACWKHEYVCNVQLSKMFSILAQVLADLWTLQLIKQ